MKPANRLLLISSALMLLTGCSAPDMNALFGESSKEPEPEPVIPYYDIDALKERIETLADSWSEEGKDAEMADEIKSLVAEADEAFSIYIRTELEYYADWKNDALSKCNSRTYEDYNVVCNMVGWAMANGYKKSAYPDLFEPYVVQDDLNYYMYNNLNRVIHYARSDADESAELLDTYYDTAFKTEVDSEETNLACAKLYLETLKSRDTSDFLYDSYSRDYTVEGAAALYEEMKEEILPVYLYLFDYLTGSDKLLMTAELKEDPYELLKTYAPKLSAPIAESVDKLFAESLYKRTEGENCYDGSYTAALTGSHSAVMYTYLDGTCYDLSTVVHEFGHFHSDWRDETPVYLQHACQDIAEVQSQGMEVLFTQFYGDIFGDRAGEYELAAAYNLLDSVVNGLAVGEFEYEVMRQLDTITPEETVELYDRIADECNLAVEMYQISHLYEQPGYYVSYGISALPAIQLYTMMQDDQAGAQALYDKIAAVSSLSGEKQFCAVMKECGFSDYFAEDSLHQITEKLKERIANLTGEDDAADIAA